MPDIHFANPGVVPASTPATTAPAFVSLSTYGSDNHNNPGDLITESTSPLQTDVKAIQGTITDAHKHFLVDTGAQLTVISTQMALDLGLDLNNPETTIDISGVGGSLTVPGYTLKELDVPTSDGGTIHFTNVPIYVLDVADDLDGILGTNLWNTANTMTVDPFYSGGGRLGLTFFTDPNRGLGDGGLGNGDFLRSHGIGFAGALAGNHNLPKFHPGANLAAVSESHSTTVGVPFSGELATFTDSDTLAKTGDFNITINWGDGTTSAGIVTQPGGARTAFHISGSHTFMHAGSAVPVSVTIADRVGSTPVTAHSTFNVASNLTGVFAVGLDNQVYAQTIDLTGHGSGWVLTSGGAVLSLSVGQDASGHPELFAVGLDNQVYTQTLNAGGQWSGWNLVSHGTIKSLVVGHDGSARPELFVLGQDNQVYANTSDTTGHWSGYALTSHGTVKSLSEITNASGRPELFAVGQDNQVYSQTVDVGARWSGWGLDAHGTVKSVSVGLDASNHPEVFVLGQDNQVYGLLFDANGAASGGYFLTARGQVQSFSVSHDAANHPELFVVGLDNQVYASKFDASGHALGGYTLTHAGSVQSLGTGSDATNHPELFVLGPDSLLYTLLFDATGTSQGGYVLTAPGHVKSVSTAH
jgi:hypothetical protein